MWVCKHLVFSFLRHHALPLDVVHQKQLRNIHHIHTFLLKRFDMTVNPHQLNKIALKKSEKLHFFIIFWVLSKGHWKWFSKFENPALQTEITFLLMVIGFWESVSNNLRKDKKRRACVEWTYILWRPKKSPAKYCNKMLINSEEHLEQTWAFCTSIPMYCIVQYIVPFFSGYRQPFNWPLSHDS